MPTPRGTIRTATARHLVRLIAELDGFTTEPEEGSFWVTRPVGEEIQNRRFVIIGTGTGTLIPDGIAAQHGPAVDVWRIPCVISVTDDPDLDIEAVEQACEDAFNAIADLLARNNRLEPGGPGCRDVRPTSLDIQSGWTSGAPPWAQAGFELTASADIERNRP